MNCKRDGRGPEFGRKKVRPDPACLCRLRIAERGIALAPGPEEEVEIPEKVAQSLLGGLKEHEQPLASALDGSGGWVKQWQNFQTARQELIDQAQGLLSQRGHQKDAASRMAEDAVRELPRGSKAEMVDNRVFHPSPIIDELKGPTSDGCWNR